MASLEIMFKLAIKYTYALHAYLVYTADDGRQQYVRGGPQANEDGLFSAGGSSGIGSGPGFGPIITKSGAHVPTSIDYPTSTNDTRRVVLLATGDQSNIEGMFNAAKQEMFDIARHALSYNPLTQNSNSDAAAGIRAAGLQPPDLDKLHILAGGREGASSTSRR